MKKRELEKRPVNKELLSLLAPMGIRVFSNKIITGEQVSKVYLIMKYPPFLDLGWLTELNSTISNISINVSIEQVDNAQFIEQVSKSMTLSSSTAQNSKDELTKQRAELQVKNAKEIIKKVDQENITYVYMSIAIKISAENEFLLEKQVKRIESKLAILGCKARVPANMIKEAYNHISPFSSQNEELLEMSKQNISLQTIMAGLPFHTSRT